MAKKGEVMNLIGQTYGKLIVIERAEDRVRPSGKHRTMWKCKCECGNEKIVDAQSLRSGDTKSCGCIHDKLSAIRLKQMAEKHGNSQTRLYGVWTSMKSRCYNSHRKSYRLYGAEGKTVCDEWLHDFQAFYGWSMENGYDETAPKGQCTLERIDGTKGYSPSNCRWATAKEQANNTRRNHMIEYNGKKQNLTQWAEKLGINERTLRDRITKLGWDIEHAFSKPEKALKKRMADYLISYKGEKHTLSEWSKIVGIKYYTLISRIHTLNWSIEKALSTPIKTRNNNMHKNNDRKEENI